MSVVDHGINTTVSFIDIKEYVSSIWSHNGQGDACAAAILVISLDMI